MAGRIKKILSIIVIIILIAVSFYFLFFGNKVVITITYTTDLQGFVTPHLQKEPIGIPAMIGGAANLAAHIKKERSFAKKNNRGFFLVDTGNFFAGQAEGYFFKGSSMIEIMNKLGYDALAVGPKDLVFGEENLIKLANEARFPFLSANIVKKNTDEIVDYLKPYIIKKHGGIKIGIIGITAPVIFSENIKNIKILDPIPVVKKHVSILKMRTDLIVILSNLGLKEDKRLAHEVVDIDIIIGGNDSEGSRALWPFYVDPQNKTIIVETANIATTCYKIDCVLTNQGKILKYKPKFTDLWITDIDPDPEIQAIVQRYTKLVEAKKKEEIGYAETPLTRSKNEESILGSWIADILREKARTDICLVGGLEADLKQGKITIGDIYNILPIIDELLGSATTNFSLTVLELSGEKINSILEHSISWAAENSKYGILQVSGLKMIYNPKLKKGERVASVIVNDKELNPNTLYKVTVNGYLASGGDGYHDIITAKKRYGTGLMDSDVIAEYVKAHSPIRASPLGRRIIRVGE